MSREESKGFTLLDRFLLVARTASGRRHLRKTWKFALNQALRAASGVQISEVLKELRHLTSDLRNELSLPDSPSFTREEFVELAENLGAGKRSGHQFVYQYLDLQRDADLRILEIGIGTNDPKAPSSMGSDGKPGSSLEMWTRLFPNALVYGADVDPKALVQGERIRSLLVDSTDPNSVKNLIQELSQLEPKGFDMIVDDGLHTPESNLRLLNLLSPLLATGGFYVVEDIPNSWSSLWETLARAASDKFESAVISEERSIKGSATFAVFKRL